MNKKLVLKRLSLILFGVGAVVAIAWNIEFWTVGRGVIAAYVAPFGIAALLASFVLKWMSR